MEKITMDEVQIKLEQIAASLQIVSEGLSEEFTAVQTSAGENTRFLSLSPADEPPPFTFPPLT